MASTDFDVVINGVKAKVKHGADSPGYRRRTVRREIENNLLSQSENPAMTSRFDQRQLYQTSWAGGSRWWKPLITPTDLESYFQSNHMDVWSEPGKVVPGNQVVDAANTQLHDDCIMSAGAAGAVYAIGSTNNVNASYYDVYKWTPASDAFVQETGYHSGVDVGDPVISMIFDPNDGYFYVLSSVNASAGDLSRFNPDTPAVDADWITTFGLRDGAYLARARDEIIYYNGATLGTLNKATPAFEVAFDDGLFNDFLHPVSTAGTNPLFRRANLSLAIASPQGLFYVKNVVQNGQPVPWVFRVDQDAAGSWIGNPISTLPSGNIALSIAFHMGSLVIAASPDWQTILNNDTEEAEIVLYHITQGQMGALGSLLGNRDELDETPYALLGSNGAQLYIGGHKRLWVYDAIRGGLHTAWEWTTESDDGPYAAMAHVEDSDGDSAMIFLATDRIARVKTSKVDDPDTVSAFGDDETHYVLTSNFFDGGLPMETKELTKVAILRESGDGGEEWTVQISADGAAFADALVLSTSGAIYGEADLSGTTGRKFQYKLIYQTKDTARKALEALLVSFTTGELISEWDLILDGSELLNIDNEVQDEEAFYDSMVSLAGTQTLVDFSDNLKEQGRLTDTDTDIKVKVMAVEVVKSKAGESDIRLVVREA